MNPRGPEPRPRPARRQLPSLLAAGVALVFLAAGLLGYGGWLLAAGDPAPQAAPSTSPTPSASTSAGPEQEPDDEPQEQPAERPTPDQSRGTSSEAPGRSAATGTTTDVGGVVMRLPGGPWLSSTVPGGRAAQTRGCSDEVAADCARVSVIWGQEPEKGLRGSTLTSVGGYSAERIAISDESRSYRGTAWYVHDLDLFILAETTGAGDGVTTGQLIDAVEQSTISW